MKHFIRVILLLFMFTTIVAAQQRKPNNIFLEIFGNAGAYSLNYDRVLFPNISVRLGVMLLPSSSKLITSFPLIMNYRFYIGSNYLEAGLGATIFSTPLNFGKFGEKTAKGKIFTGVIGYCFQTESGIIARISFTPFYDKGKIIPFGGFSFGYNF